jgi:hypothetical protein
MWVGHVAFMGELINVKRILAPKHEGKRKQRSRHRWMSETVKMYLNCMAS